MERGKAGKIIDLASFALLDQPQTTATTSNPKKKRKMTEKAKQKLEADILSMDAEDREVLLGRIQVACQNQTDDPSSANEKHTTSSELSQLRLQLGSLLQKQAELRTREKKVRGLIKKLHRQESRLELAAPSSSKRSSTEEKYTEEMILKRLFDYHPQPSNVDGAAASSSSSSLWALARHEMLSQTEKRRLQPDRDCQLLEVEIVIDQEKGVTEEVVIDLEAVDNNNYGAPAAANSVLSQFISLFNNVNDDSETSHDDVAEDDGCSGEQLSTLVRALLDVQRQTQAVEQFEDNLDQLPDLEVSLKDELQALLDNSISTASSIQEHIRNILSWQQSIDTIGLEIFHEEHVKSVLLQFWSLSRWIVRYLLLSLHQQLLTNEQRPVVPTNANENSSKENQHGDNNEPFEDYQNDEYDYHNDEKENYNSQQHSQQQEIITIQHQANSNIQQQQQMETPSIYGGNKRRGLEESCGGGVDRYDLLSTSFASKRQKKSSFLPAYVQNPRDAICLITPNIKEAAMTTTHAFPAVGSSSVARKVDVDLCYSDSENDNAMEVQEDDDEPQERYVPLFERLKAISTQLEQQQRQQTQQQGPQPAAVLQTVAVPPSVAVTDAGNASVTNLHSMSLSQLQAMCTQYGLVMSDDRDRMIRLLSAILKTTQPPIAQSAPSSSSAAMVAGSTQQPRIAKAPKGTAPRSQQQAASTSSKGTKKQRAFTLPSPAKGAALTTMEQNVIEQVAYFVQNDEDLYSRVLCFAPLAPEEVLSKMIASGVASYGGISYQHIRTALDHMHVFAKGLPRR